MGDSEPRASRPGLTLDRGLRDLFPGGHVAELAQRLPRATTQADPASRSVCMRSWPQIQHSQLLHRSPPRTPRLRRRALALPSRGQATAHLVCFSRYMAASACRRSSSHDTPSSGKRLTPMLAATAISWPSSRNGACSAASTLAATCAASCCPGHARPTARRARLPRTGATVSPARTLARTRRRAPPAVGRRCRGRRSRSPLEIVEVEEQEARWSARRRACVIARPRRSRSRLRLGRPVRSSW